MVRWPISMRAIVYVQRTTKRCRKEKTHLLENVYAVPNLKLQIHSLTECDIKQIFKNAPSNFIKPNTNIVSKKER